MGEWDQSTSRRDRWVTFPKPNPQARLRLFCFPYAGGGASIFRPWADALPAMIEVCPVQLPGREARMKEPPFTRLPPLVQAAVRCLIPHLDKPFAFFGHSMGALLSFELARELRRRRSREPAHLFVSGCSAPQITDPDPPIHSLPARMFIENLRLLNGTPRDALDHQELMEVLLPPLRADFAVYETYVYADEPPLPCPITAFGGLEDGKVSRDCLDAWRRQTRASFALRMLPGDHFFLRTAQPLLLQAVSHELGQFVNSATQSRCL